MKRKLLLFAGIGLIAIVPLWFYRDYSSKQRIAMHTADATLGDMELLVTAQGTLEPKEYVDVGAQISGLIEKLHVEIGDEVKQGDLIAEIDPDVYTAQVQADEAKLKMLKAQKAEQQAYVKQATQKLERNSLLYKDKAVSKEVWEDAGVDLDVAKAKLDALQAQIEEATSTLEKDRTNLGYTKIYAPMSGTVVSRAVQEGQTINAVQSAPTIVQIANLDIMTVRADVAEADVSKLDVGMPMYFTILGLQERRWEGNVRQILPTPTTVNDVVLYNVLVDIENPDRRLMNGMTTQMFFIVKQVKNLPIIPLSALIKRQPEADTNDGKAYEVLVLKNGKPEPRIVIATLEDRNKAAISKGIEAGETVLLKPLDMPSSALDDLPKGSKRLTGMGMGRL